MTVVIKRRRNKLYKLNYALSVKRRRNEQDKATADFAKEHTKKYVTEQKRKVNEVL